MPVVGASEHNPPRAVGAAVPVPVGVEVGYADVGVLVLRETNDQGLSRADSHGATLKHATALAELHGSVARVLAVPQGSGYTTVCETKCPVLLCSRCEHSPRPQRLKHTAAA